MAIDYWDELGNSPTLDLGLSHSRAKREGKIPWSRITDFVNDIFPIAGEPASMPGFPSLRAVGLHIEPLTGEKTKVTLPVPSDLTFTSMNQHEWAKATVEFETLPYNSDDDSGNPDNVDPVLLLSHRWSVGGEFITIEAKGLRWCDGTEVDPNNEGLTAGLLVPTIEHQITWPRVLAPPFEVIRSRIGTVNSSQMTFKTGTIYPETLLFIGAELNRDIKTDGSLAWEVAYRFSEKRVEALVPSTPLNEAACLAAGGTWTGTSCVGGSQCGSGYRSQNCGSPDNQGDCEDAGGTWDGSACSDYYGGWNHFYRSDKIATGFVRLQTNTPAPGTEPDCTAAGGFWNGTACTCLPGGNIYRLRSFDDLFVEEV